MEYLVENKNWKIYFTKKRFLLASINLRAVCLVAALFLSLGIAMAQNKKVTLALKEVTVKEALEKLKTQVGYSLWFNAQDVSLNKIISVDIRNSTVEEALDVILKGQRLNYEVKDKHIQIRKENRQQDKKSTRVITGKVSGETDRTPLIGCTVRVKGKQVAAITDVDGNYTIEVESSDVLLFSYIGYDPREVSVGNKMVCNVQLSDDSILMEDVVVTGYQTLKKYNMTGAVNVVNNKNIELRSSNSLGGLLEGAVPGLTVYKDDYRIRGGASLQAGTKPLFIVDDFEVESLPDNMEMVESITVLKDAAATAVWGSRAANGVIVITTKRGKKDDFRISYSNNFKFSAHPDFDDLHRANAAELIDYERDSYSKNYLYDVTGTESGYSASFGAFMDHMNGKITDAELDSRLDALTKLSNRKQIEDNLMRSAFSQQHLLSISGGSGKLNYYLSGSFIGGHSNYVGDSNNSVNINSRTSYEILPFLTLRSDINATFSNDNNGYEGLAGEIYNMWPYQMLLDENGGYIYDYSDYNQVEALRLEEMGFRSEGNNLMENVALANNKTKGTGYKVRVGSDFKILKGLDFSADFQYEKKSSTTKNIQSKDSYFTRNLVNNYTEIGENDKLINHIPNGDVLDHRQENWDAWILKLGATLNRTFGADDKHYVNAVVGFEMRSRTYTDEKYRKLGYDDQLLSWQPIDQLLLSKTGIQWWTGDYHRYDATSYDKFGEVLNREVSTFASAVYTYDNRYSLSGSMRIDESNLFGVSSKYRRNPIWSVGANWNVKNEPFFKSEAITNLIVRASVGLTGNFDRSGATTPVMVGRRQFLSSVNSYITRLQSPPNPSLRWERNRSFNISSDISLWNRLNATVTYYNNFCYDLLGMAALDPTVGYSSAKVNAADMRNEGVEVLLSGDIIRTRDFTWNASWVLAYNKNKVTKNNISDSAPYHNMVTGLTKYVKGYSRDALWSYRWAGLDAAGNPQVYDKDGNITRDITSLSAEDLVCSGTTQPKFNGSLTTGFRYKSLQLNLLFAYNFGHVFRVEYPDMNPWSSTPAVNERIVDRWREPGDELITDIPSIPADMNDLFAPQGRDAAAHYSSNSVRKGDMVRLREILLNYDFPQSLLKNTPIRRLALTVQLNNIGLWTANKEGYDPEAVDPISGTFSLRQPLTFTAGLKVDF